MISLLLRSPSFVNSECDDTVAFTSVSWQRQNAVLLTSFHVMSVFSCGWWIATSLSPATCKMREIMLWAIGFITSHDLACRRFARSDRRRHIDIFWTGRFQRTWCLVRIWRFLFSCKVDGITSLALLPYSKGYQSSSDSPATSGKKLMLRIWQGSSED